jgi:hypothetical protein
MHEGKIVEVLERFDVGLRERFSSSAESTPSPLALYRHCGIKLIKRPGVSDADDLAVGIEKDFRP